MTKIGGGGFGTTLILALLLVIVSVAAGAGLVYLISTPAATNHASQSSAISRLPTSWWPPFALHRIEIHAHAPALARREQVLDKVSLDLDLVHV
jgi:hypothetical protein